MINIKETWVSGVKAWRIGNINEMNKQHGGEKMRAEFPTSYKLFFTDRNNRWLSKMEAMFTSADVELILVGALHLAGPDGLIQKLNSNGYKVEQLD